MSFHVFVLPLRLDSFRITYEHLYWSNGVNQSSSREERRERRGEKRRHSCPCCCVEKMAKAAAYMAEGEKALNRTTFFGFGKAQKYEGMEYITCFFP